MKLRLPDNNVVLRAESYGQYATDNYGAHTMRFEVEGIGLFWFSYETLVAFQIAGGKTYVHQNDWGPSTGKHLNLIDGGLPQARLTDEAFQEMLDAEMSRYAGNPTQGN